MPETAPPPPRPKKPRNLMPSPRTLLGVATAALWLATVLLRGRILAALEEHKVEPEKIDEAVLLVAALVVVPTIAKVVWTRAGRAAFVELGARGLACALFALLASRSLVGPARDHLHLVQYGLVASIFAIAFKNPRVGFVAGAFLGFVDETYGWFTGPRDATSHVDWSRMCLDACGAAAGALPWTCFNRVRRFAAGIGNEVMVVTRTKPVRAAIGLVVLSLIVAWVIFAADLGHYPAWPRWRLAGSKPFIMLSTREGLPALLGLTLVLYYLVDERRRQLPLRSLVATLVAVNVGLAVPVLEPEAPRSKKLPHIAVPHAASRPKADGKLEASEWQGAATVDLVTMKGLPSEPAKARLLWDERALYVGFECPGKDAPELGRDDPRIAESTGVAVFLDLDSAERSYFAFDVTPRNAVLDRFVYIPEVPQWVPQPGKAEFVDLPGWDARRLETGAASAGDRWSAELAIPWDDMKGAALPAGAGRTLRANLYARTQSGTILAWSPAEGTLDVHRPDFFGVLELAK